MLSIFLKRGYENVKGGTWNYVVRRREQEEKGRQCGGLRRSSTQQLMCVRAWPTGSSTMGGVALLGWVWSPWRKCVTRVQGAGFEVSDAQAQDRGFTVLFLLDAGQDVELLATSPAPCLPTGCHASCHMVMV